METKRRLTFAAALSAALLSIASPSEAGVSLAWTPTMDSRVVGHYVWYGTNTRGYSNVINVVGSNMVNIPPLVSNRVYNFTVTAYDTTGMQSPTLEELTLSTAAALTIAPGGVTYTMLGGLASGVTIGAGAAVTVAPGAKVTFAPSVVAAAPATYGWSFGGKPIKGATNVSYTIASAAITNAGAYQLTVSNLGGSVSSSPMTLQVVPKLAGAYNGLFYQTNANGTTNFNIASSGMLGNLVVGASGVYSGKMYVNNAALPLSGVFDLYGNTSAVVSNAPAGQSNLFVQLHLNSALAAAQVTGSVSNMSRNNAWVATLAADSASISRILAGGAVRLFPASGIYTNTGLFSTANAGAQCWILGVAPDNGMFVTTVPISTTGRVPIYSSQRSGQGLIEGWMQLSNSVPKGNLAWVQNAIAGTAYPKGFTNMMTLSP